jgi:hypothetical protein
MFEKSFFVCLLRLLCLSDKKNLGLNSSVHCHLVLWSCVVGVVSPRLRGSAEGGKGKFPLKKENIDKRGGGF